MNTRRKDKSWPKEGKLIHVNGTHCSDTCITNEHHGKYAETDQPQENITTDRNNTEGQCMGPISHTQTNNIKQESRQDTPMTVTPSSPQRVIPDLNNSKAAGLSTTNVSDKPVNTAMNTLIATDKPDLPNLQNSNKSSSQTGTSESTTLESPTSTINLPDDGAMDDETLPEIHNFDAYIDETFWQLPEWKMTKTMLVCYQWEVQRNRILSGKLTLTRKTYREILNWRWKT